MDTFVPPSYPHLAVFVAYFLFNRHCSITTKQGLFVMTITFFFLLSLELSFLLLSLQFF